MQDQHYKMKQLIEVANSETLKEFQEYWKPTIDKLKEQFAGSGDYLSGINDGMYEIINHIAVDMDKEQALMETQLCLLRLINKIRGKGKLALNPIFQKAVEDGLYIIEKHSTVYDSLRVVQSNDAVTK